MEINEVNKKLYESSFVSDGTFGDLDNWKPDIDERLIEESCEDENGNWVPATPLGYRDYKLSREEGIFPSSGEYFIRAPNGALRHIFPPFSPAPGPTSTIQSALIMVSMSCSTTITEFPSSRSSFNEVMSLRLSLW